MVHVHKKQWFDSKQRQMLRETLGPTLILIFKEYRSSFYRNTAAVSWNRPLYICCWF